MLRLAAAVFLLLLALPARANLGDSVAEAIKRYGKPERFSEATAVFPFGTLVFTAGPYSMTVFLYNNAEVGARVSKKDKSDFTPIEMKTIMDADASTAWVPTATNDPTNQKWTRSDRSTVIYDTAKKMLIFTSPDMAAELHNPPPTPPPTPAPATNAAPAWPKPQGDFAPATPTQWVAPQATTNAAPATNAP
jgi:hypothetical protein